MSSQGPSRGSLLQSCQIIYHFITVFIISDQSGEYFKTKQNNINITTQYTTHQTHYSQAVILSLQELPMDQMNLAGGGDQHQTHLDR